MPREQAKAAVIQYSLRRPTKADGGQILEEGFALVLILDAPHYKPMQHVASGFAYGFVMTLWAITLWSLYGMLFEESAGGRIE